MDARTDYLLKTIKFGVGEVIYYKVSNDHFTSGTIQNIIISDRVMYEVFDTGENLYDRKRNIKETEAFNTEEEARLYDVEDRLRKIRKDIIKECKKLKPLKAYRKELRKSMLIEQLADLK